ncbi:hypothetical protein DM806_01320 [Sphingobium lactosutens]|uniref:DUF5818 domain-containing protein n=1 Tax=Sphingobium lactosutens TaxID=522773 RepID=UPI0015B89CBE|nr:DUF5818 domain-containing protein [Sphingobium lactosutens]NWK94345.1 hypothetical protein [Sphingobium lactosutens]
MPRGTRHDLTGVLLMRGASPILRMADGGEWRLDLSGRYRHLLGNLVRVEGCRSEFDMLDVEIISLA